MKMYYHTATGKDPPPLLKPHYNLIQIFIWICNKFHRFINISPLNIIFSSRSIISFILYLRKLSKNKKMSQLAMLKKVIKKINPVTLWDWFLYNFSKVFMVPRG